MITLCEGHVYRDEDGVEYPGVTSILKSAGIIDEAWFNEYSRLRGEYAHLACAMYDRGTLDESSLDEAIAPYVAAWRRFRAESGYVPTATEQVVANKTHRFAGTLDSAGTLNDRLAIIDRKTGACPKWGGLQLAGYALALPGALRLRRVCELHNDGTYRLVPFDDPNDTFAFLAALNIHNWKANHK
jgi:hypothetical protein